VTDLANGGTKTAERGRRDGMSLLILGAAIYLTVGLVFLQKLSFSMTDFKVVYFSARCLTQHCDPYSMEEMRRLFYADPEFSVEGRPGVQLVVERYFYPPMTFAVTAPLAVLPFGAAESIWIFFSTVSYLFGAFLMWRLAARSSPIWSGVLVGFLLANSVWLFMIGNAAILSTGLCLIAAYAFIEKRWELAGVVLLVISLLLKPHSVGPVWLYFALASSSLRKRAMQALALIVLVSIPVLLWTGSVAPHWLSELRGNASFFASHGSYADPGPRSGIDHDIDPVVELQSVVSVLWERPALYNTITYAICAVLLLIWIGATVRLKPTHENAWLGLAAVSALAMLPLYHRQHDARLILLCIPACLALWAEGGRRGQCALAITGASFFLLSDLGTVLRIGLVEPWLKLQGGISGKILTVFLGRPAQLSLFCLALFYLWVYARHAWGPGASSPSSPEIKPA
jgi:Glycosyltransferase family 87